jgi:hypothetical protein
MGSIYTYDSGGRVSRQKSALGSTMEASTSSFDRTVFVSPEDRGAVEIGYKRGLKPLEDGTLQGLDYNEDKLDKVKFLELRQKGVSFDEAYISSGGTITPRSITPELQPQMGYYPFEYNLGDNKYHAGSKVVQINRRPQPTNKPTGKATDGLTGAERRQRAIDNANARKAQAETRRAQKAASGVKVGKPADDVSTTVAEKAHFLHDQDLYISPSGQAGNLDTEYLDALEATMGDDALERGVPLVGDRTA